MPNIPDAPLTREEQYLAAIANGGGTVPPAPLTRVEQYLNAILQGGGGGGASSLAGLSDVDLTNIAVGDGLMYDGEKFVSGVFITPLVVGSGYADIGDALDPDMVEYMRHHEPCITISQQWAIEAEGDSVNGIAFVRPTFASGASGRLTRFDATIITDSPTDPFYFKVRYTVNEDNEITGVQLLDSSAPLHVTLTPTAADYSGTFDVPFADILTAYNNGRRIICDITGMTGRFELSYGGSSNLNGIFVTSMPGSSALSIVLVRMKSNNTFDVTVGAFITD